MSSALISNAGVWSQLRAVSKYDVNIPIAIAEKLEMVLRNPMLIQLIGHYFATSLYRQG